MTGLGPGGLAPSTPRTRARAGAAFALTGTATAVMTLVDPDPTVNEELYILVSAGLSALLAALLLAVGERFPLSV